MQEVELKFSRKHRHAEAPFCPCGQENSRRNPQFAPFSDCDGKYGYCHQCDKNFMPNNTQDEVFVYVPPVKATQLYIQEPIWNWIFVDAMIEPDPGDNKTKISGKYFVIWYYRNINGKLTSAKKMQYDFPKFKRDKDRHPVYPYTRDSGYYGCLFYEHYLTLYPNAIVILVESEKTAALLTHKFKANLEEFIFIAVGGSNGLTDDKITVLKGRTIWIAYDCDNGELQPDGSVKSPKGREAAQSAYVKLAAIANPLVIDIDPESTDGKDLGDIWKEIDITYIRDLGEKDAVKTKIPPALLEELRFANRNAERLNDERIKQLGEDHGVDPHKIVTLYKIVRQNFASERGLNNAPIIPKIEHWLLEHYEFQKNTITSRVYFKKRGEASWRECETADIWRDIHHDIRSIGKGKRGGDLTVAKGDLENILDSSFVPKWNPISEYFNNLPEWDNKDHITALANHIQTEDQPFWIAQFKKALVRMIACSIGGVVNRMVMVLVQEQQESGKSSFLRFLCPKELASYYKEDPINHDKDAEIAFAENFLWNLEELDDLNKKQVSEMKAIISRETIKQRRSYARHETSMRRIVNFWGSTNKNEFLADTQNTRWLCFNVKSINHDYENIHTNVKNIDITRVWAQAWHLYKTGFQYTLTADERLHRDTSNQRFMTTTDEDQFILKYLKPALKGNPVAKFMMNAEIQEFLIHHVSGKIRIDGRNIGRSMTKLKFVADVKKINKKSVRGYWVEEVIKGNEYDSDAPAQIELNMTVEERIEAQMDDMPF